MSLLPEDSARILGSSGFVVAIVDDSFLSGLGESVSSSAADGGSLSLVFLVGGDVADAGVEPDRVAVGSLDVELGAEHVDVFDEFEVGVLGFEVTEQRLDPGLVRWGGWPAVVWIDGSRRMSRSSSNHGIPTSEWMRCHRLDT